MRGVVAAVTILLALVAGAASAGTASRTSLTVTYWEQGTSTGKKTIWTLACNPASGSLARPARACQRLASGARALFAPLRKDMICTQIYGGPQVALVAGMLDGRRLWARFQRRNGCEVARWNGLAPWLLPPGGAA